jgi:hypothetical protein
MMQKRPKYCCYAPTSMSEFPNKLGECELVKVVDLITKARRNNKMAAIFYQFSEKDLPKTRFPLDRMQ